MTLDPYHPDDLNLALFLDLDGTLIDLAAEPTGVAAPPGLAAMLQNLSRRLDGALAIVTGRTLAELDHLLAPARLRAAGVHGAEIREQDDGEIIFAALPLEAAFVDSVRRLAELDPGIIVETKSASISVHYRQAEALGPEVERRLRALLPNAAAPLDLRHGKKVVEAIPSHVSKGAALRAFMQRPPFAGRRPIAIGDDLGDLSAFEAAEFLGGRSLRVAGEFFDGAEADFAGTAEVRRWLWELSSRISEARKGGV